MAVAKSAASFEIKARLLIEEHYYVSSMRMTEGPDTYRRLRSFLVQDMRMSHIYQPVMLKELIEGSGEASLNAIAAAFLAHDQAQLEVRAFNVGMSCGEVAGQTISHAHVHLIPRRRGDVKDPRGGVRAVVPGKAPY